MKALYENTLEELKELPADATYRVNVEKITKYRLSVVQDSEDIDVIEAKLNIGQIPEIIEQAQDELDLIPHMKQWKPWQIKDGEKKPVLEVVE